MKATTPLSLLLLSLIYIQTTHPFQLRTSSTIPVNKKTLHTFLGTPTNWPQIVLSSHSVKPPSLSRNRIDTPLKVGDFVEEVFGLPPLFPLSVVWQCVVCDVDEGILEFYSEDGVSNLARECKMRFDIDQIECEKCVVDLIMEFEPLNPIVPLGMPFLKLDNELALRVLLPRVMDRIG